MRKTTIFDSKSPLFLMALFILFSATLSFFKPSLFTTILFIVSIVLAMIVAFAQAKYDELKLEQERYSKRAFDLKKLGFLSIIWKNRSILVMLVGGLISLLGLGKFGIEKDVVADGITMALNGDYENAMKIGFGIVSTGASLWLNKDPIHEKIDPLEDQRVG
jgi:magnesium-transporting ATPase (P-type)